MTEPTLLLIRSDVLEAARQALATAIHPGTPWAVVNELIVKLQDAKPLGLPQPVESQEEAAE